MIFSHRGPAARSSPREKLVIAAVVFGLLGIATWVRDRGARPNPELFRPAEGSFAGTPAVRLAPHPGHPVIAGAAGVADLLGAGLCGPGWKRDGEVQSFGPDNLYEKIDGREGLYKSYNFRGLWAASYDSSNPPAARLDVEVFLQGSPLDAYGVLSTERQGMSTSTRAAPDRTLTPNGLYFLAGAHYVRLVGSEASPRVEAALAAAAGKLAGLAPVATSTLSPAPLPSPAGPADGAGASPLLPSGMLEAPESWSPASNPLLSLGADPATLQYQAQDGLGQEYFKGIYLASLPAGPTRVTAFLFAAPDAAAAGSTFARYRSFLATQGKPATEPELAGTPPGTIAVKIALLDTWEWAFVAGRFVAGVTEADDPGAARAACALLGKALGAR